MTQRIQKTHNLADAKARRIASYTISMNDAHKAPGDTAGEMPHWAKVMLGCYGISPR